MVAHSMTVVAVQAGFGEYVFDQQPGRGPGRARRDPDRDQRGAGRHAADARRAPPGRAGARRASRRPAAAGRRPRRSRLRPPLRWRPRPAWPTWTGWWRARAGRRHPGRGPADRSDRRAIPAGIDLSAFRIVQEALTNVVKHSGADRCLVRIAHGAASCASRSPTRASGPFPPRRGARAWRWPPLPSGGQPSRGRAAQRAGLAPGGHGIAGMRERVSLCGGEFAAGPLPGRASGSPPGSRCRAGRDEAPAAQRGHRAGRGDAAGRRRRRPGPGPGRVLRHRRRQPRTSPSSARPAPAPRRSRGPPDPARRRPDGRPDAGHGRHRGHPADHRAGRGGRARVLDPDHLRPGRVRLLGAARRGQRLPAQEHPARRPARAPSGWSPAGDALLAPSVTRRLVAEFVRRPAPPAPATPAPAALAAITAREREVLDADRHRPVQHRDRRRSCASAPPPPRPTSATCWPS